MKTFNCWLIANFEITTTLLTIIATSIIFWGFAGGLDNKTACVIYIVGGISLLATIPMNRVVIQLGKYIIMLIEVTFFMIIKRDDTTTDIFFQWFWLFFGIASVISAFLSLYTYTNFNEVVSRRILWRNSNVSLFENPLLYALERFCNISISIIVCTGYIVILLKLIN